MPLWEPNTAMVTALKDDFGCDVFDEKHQREFLAPSAFKKFNKLQKAGEHNMVDVELANQVAEGMKTWAQGRGATHWTHWFQPLTEKSAEKHDSFIGRSDQNGHPLLDLTGEQLIRGEPDASSFPSGGLRNTAEARGYTVWDPVSPAFLIHMKHGAVLYIPCSFVSWTKDALDCKTPLLKSEEKLSEHVCGLLNELDDESTRVLSTLGCEQEFFIVDRQQYLKRTDLLLCGRTVQGTQAPKGQELDDHYFGTIPRKVAACLQEMEMQLWHLGIPVTTRHNEVCPSQHEFAPLFEATSVASDHQMLMMNVMKAKAEEDGFACLLHEKPFAGLNGSGKHNNWSMSTDTGVNLLNPPEQVLANPATAFSGLENTRFTVILAAVIKAVDDHAGVLRCAVANHGQDFRLGANEAPPAIISVYLGGALQNLVDEIIKDVPDDGKMSPKSLQRSVNESGLVIDQTTRLPKYKRDRTDRNRTSPFAFTGNKFEFRAVGSAQNVAVPVCAVNTAVAAACEEMTQAIAAKVAAGTRKRDAIRQVAVETFTKHYRVLFNGDGYSDAWVVEAEKRGLLNLRSTPKAFLGVDQVPLYTRMGVMSEAEVLARKEVSLENYCKAKGIEMKCLNNMTSKVFVPAAQRALARMGASQQVSSVPEVAKQIAALAKLLDTVLKEQTALQGHLAHHTDDLAAEATHIDEKACATMDALRAAADSMEEMCTEEEWDIPNYKDMLFIQCPE